MEFDIDGLTRPLEKDKDAAQDSCAADSNRCLISITTIGEQQSAILACHRYIFYNLGTFISEHPKCIIAFMLTFAAGLSCCNLRLTFNDDFRTGYSQLDPQSEKEHAVFLDFAGFARQPYIVALVGQSVDGGSMLRKEQFMTMRNEIQRGLSIPINVTGDVKLIPRRLRDQIVFSDEPQFALIETALMNPNPQVVLSYPVGTFFNQKIMMARAIFGYKNGSAPILSYYFAFMGDDKLLPYIKQAEVLWSEQLKATENSITKMRLFGDAVVNNEISEGAFGACPYFLIGSLFMVLFVLATVMRYDKNIWHVLCLTFWTIFCPLLAASCSMAILSLLGIPINCVMLITPFLVLGVGVDDAFIMMHHWFQSNEFDRDARLRSVLIRVGPSISLTSFTNIAAFLIGSVLSAPDLQLFCFSSALAFTLDWFFQLFIFTPVLQCFKQWNYSLPMLEKKKRWSVALFYCEWLRMPPVRIALLVLVALYWVVSITAGLRMEENFSPEKTFDSESFLAKSLVENEKMFFDHEMIRVFIPDLPENSSLLLNRMRQFREIEYLCKDFPTWLEEYDAGNLGANKTDTAGYFENFGFYLAQNPSVLRDVQFERDSNGLLRVSKIAFDLCVHGFGSWRDRALMLRDLRSRVPEGFSIYLSESAVLAMILSSRAAICKSVVITVACMVIICSLFIPTFRAVVAAILSVASITVGVIGGLYFWGADLDTMVLVNVVMAVGLTVDFSAHISYHCFCEDSDLDNPGKFAEAILAVAYPSAEAALTTVICVLPLYFYRVYMYVTFAKTILLIASIGLIHTVFIIPLIISML